MAWRPQLSWIPASVLIAGTRRHDWSLQASLALHDCDTTWIHATAVTRVAVTGRWRKAAGLLFSLDSLDSGSRFMASMVSDMATLLDMDKILCPEPMFQVW